MTENLRRNWLIYVFLITITLAVYSRVTEFKFVHFDDGVYVTDNYHVKTGLNFENIRWAFAGKYECNWMPLTWISFMLDHEVSARSDSAEYVGEENPAVYHLTNLIVHVLNTLLLFVVLNAFTGYRWRSAMVAALFAVHPLHVESVAWVAERKDVLSTFFMMLTLWAYLWYAKRPGMGRYLLVTAAFSLGLMSKSMLVTIPVLLLLLDFWPLKRLVGWKGGKESPGEPLRRLVIEKVPLFALALVVSVIAVIAQERGDSLQSFANYPLGVRLANAVVSYIVYISKTFWPVKLACIYPHPRNSIPFWQVISSGLLLLSITLAAARSARRLPFVAVGWLWYLIAMLPVIGIVQVGLQAMADRYTYIPMIGISVAVVWGLSELLANRRAGVVVLAVMSCVVLACLAARAYRQAGYWSDDLVLFGHAVEVTHDNAIAHFNLGDALVADGQIDAAIPHFRAAIRIDPNKAEPHNNLGVYFLMRSDIAAAREQFEVAVRLRPDYVDAQRNLATVLMKAGKVSEAIVHLKIAQRLQPDNELISQALEEAEALRPAPGQAR